MPKLKRLELERLNTYASEFDMFKIFKSLHCLKLNYCYLTMEEVQKLLNGRLDGFLLHFGLLKTDECMRASTLRAFMKKHEKYILSFKLDSNTRMINDEVDKSSDDLFTYIFLRQDK